MIDVADVSKSYRIYAQPQDRLKQAILRHRQYYREFWALRGVSLEVRRGEAVGIVGRNGSGKSTLLQIIAGTLRPTVGSVRVSGRVAPMLELGTGFNLEFSGRDNVFLNAAVLGLGRREIEARFDDIAAFADIGDFIDQPLKTYSSGMVARLAFSVAFAVEPEILIVDEILAVGDVGFQQKCLAQLRVLRERGLTLLFVSHSADAVRSVCQRALFLAEGRSIFFGKTDQAVDLYLSHVREETNRDALRENVSLGPAIAFTSRLLGRTRYGTGHVQIQQVEILDRMGVPCRSFELGDEIVVEVRLRSERDVRDLSLSFLIRDMTGVDLMGTTTFDERIVLPALRPGASLRVRFRFENRLRPGNFGVSVAVNRVSSRDYSDTILFDQADGCAAFVILAKPDRPVHYKFHQPVQVSWDTPEYG